MIGVVLIVGLAVMGVTGIMLFGASALSDAHTRSEIDAAEHAMTQLDSKFSLVALGSADRQGSMIDLSGDATMRVDGDQGWMNVSVVNRADGNYTILNTTLGAVTYENGGTTVAYQGGGVWKRAEGGGSVMISPPEFHYRTRGSEDPTLTLPLVTVRGEGTLTEDATVSRDVIIPRFPDPGVSNRTNPLRRGEIIVTVHSEYYQAWGSFFEERTGGSVTFDHDREQVTISLLIQQSTDAVGGGIVSGAAGDTLTFGQGVETDSYNSTIAPYDPDNPGDDTSIIAAGGVTLEQNAKVSGDLLVGRTVKLEKNTKVTGDVTYGGSKDIHENAVVGGTVQSGADVQAPGAVDWLIDQRREALSDPDDNNNDDPDADVSENSLVDCNPCTLPAGDYYLDEIAIASGEELVLNTTDGDVDVVVDGDVSIKGKVRVEDPNNTARLYVEKDFSATTDNAKVSVPGDRSTALWIYMNPGRSAHFQKVTRFVGVVYGPGDGAQSGVEIDLQSNNEIYGGLVGWLPDGVGQQDEVHFDEALVHEDPLEGYGDHQPTVTYLHVTENRVNVSSR